MSHIRYPVDTKCGHIGSSINPNHYTFARTLERHSVSSQKDNDWPMWAVCVVILAACFIVDKLLGAL